MTVKILLERKFREDPSADEIKIINELRMAAMQRKGYISGETLVDLNDYRRIVVISVWSNKRSWDAWENSELRQKLESRINESLKQPPIIRVFMLGADYLGEVFEEVVHDSEVK